MKKKILFLFLFVCLFLTGCSNGFAKREYNSDGKIAKQEDHYAKKNSVYNPIVGGCRLTVGEFDGRETLWSIMTEEEQEMEVSIHFALSEGQAKIAYIDDAICCWYALDIVRAIDGLDEVIEDCAVDEATSCFIEGYKRATDLTEEQQQTFMLMRRLVRLQEYATLLHVMSEPIIEMPEWMIGLTDKLKCKLCWLEKMMESGYLE